MRQFFSQYKVQIVVSAAVLGFAGVIMIVVILVNSSNEPPTIIEPTDPNQLDYGFVNNDQLSNEDKYLMLEAKIVVEGYGTYSANDLRGLYDVKNKSTSSFAVTVDQLINLTVIPSLATSVNPDTIQIERSSNLVTVKLQANQRNLTTNQTTQINYTVEFVKNGQFWQVNNITEQ